MASKGLPFDGFKKSVESILCTFQNVKIHELLPHQSQALYHFISGKDTFVVLPTGHGKSLIYQMSVHYAKEVVKSAYEPSGPSGRSLSRFL